MSKAILVLDMPDSCSDCPLHNYHFCNVTGEPIDEDIIPDHCLLKEAPEKELLWYENDNDDYWLGWNHCVDYILDEEN